MGGQCNETGTESGVGRVGSQGQSQGCAGYRWGVQSQGWAGYGGRDRVRGGQGMEEGQSQGGQGTQGQGGL